MGDTFPFNYTKFNAMEFDNVPNSQRKGFNTIYVTLTIAFVIFFLSMIAVIVATASFGSLKNSEVRNITSLVSPPSWTKTSSGNYYANRRPASRNFTATDYATTTTINLQKKMWTINNKLADREKHSKLHPRH